MNDFAVGIGRSCQGHTLLLQHISLHPHGVGLRIQPDRIDQFGPELERDWEVTGNWDGVKLCGTHGW